MSFLVRGLRAAKTKRTRMATYRYMLHRTASAEKDAAIESALTKFGDSGWHVIHADRTSSGWTFILELTLPSAIEATPFSSFG